MGLLLACSGSSTSIEKVTGTPDAPVAEGDGGEIFDAGVSDAPVTPPPDIDAALPVIDAAVMPPPVIDAPPPPPPLIDAPPPPMGAFRILGYGIDFLEASSDQGGNVWGASAAKVYFFRDGAGDGFTFDQSNGLAHGQTTWIDTYWFGTDASPSVQPVSFTSVAGGMAGQVFIGNIGYIGDRLEIDPASGAIQLLMSLEVTEAQQSDPTEFVEQKKRETSTLHALVDLNGAWNGAVWFGGWHGLSVLHAMTKARTSGICGCADYEEHVHPFSADGEVVYGGDVHGMALTPAGDLWLGDKTVLYFLPQGSLGPYADLFVPFAIPGRPDLQTLDVFPGVPDLIHGIALDAEGGIYVASFGNGLAYVAPASYATNFWTASDVLPTNYLTGVEVDPAGDVWIATKNMGILRYTPSTGRFVRITSADGLPSDRVRAISLDRYRTGRTLYFATDQGIAIYDGP